MGHPVYVCVPSQPNQSITLSVPGTAWVSRPEEPATWSSEPIGYLASFSAEIDEWEKVQRDLDPLGLKIVIVSRAVKAQHGCSSLILALGVNVETLEDAQALPGFVPLGITSGPVYPPPDTTGIEFDAGSDVFEGLPIKRVSAATCYKNYTRPPYDQTGMFRVSGISTGQIIEYFFFQDDPEYLYIVMPFTEASPAIARRAMEAWHS